MASPNGLLSTSNDRMGALRPRLGLAGRCDAYALPPSAPLTRASRLSPCRAVLLHVKRSDKDSFLFDTPAASEVDVVVRELVKVQNMRGKVNRLAASAEQLALYGPMKTPEQQGLDDDTPLLEDYDVKSGQVVPHASPVHGANYRQDPSERRTGDCTSDELAQVIQKTVEDAKALTAEQTTVALKRPTTSAALEEAINNIRGAVMIVYPMGLPDYDHVRQILEERETLEGAEGLEVHTMPRAHHARLASSAAAASPPPRQAVGRVAAAASGRGHLAAPSLAAVLRRRARRCSLLQVLDVERTSLWVFSKEMQPEKLLSDYVGKNDKSKVVAKLQKKGANAPAREPVVSDAEQKAMIAFYHKKESEMKRMELEDEDAYQHSTWANPKALKNAFTGVGDINWRAGR
jgi:hypothetical protein